MDTTPRKETDTGSDHKRNAKYNINRQADGTTYNRIVRYNTEELADVENNLEEIIRQEEEYSAESMNDVLTQIDPRFKNFLNENTVYYDSLEEVDELLTQNTDFLKEKTLPDFRGKVNKLNLTKKETEGIADQLGHSPFGGGGTSGDGSQLPGITDPGTTLQTVEVEESEKSEKALADTELKPIEKVTTPNDGDDKDPSGGEKGPEKPDPTITATEFDPKKLNDGTTDGPKKTTDTPISIITPGGITPRALTGNGEKGTDNLATSAKTSVGKMGKNILDALGKETSKLMGGITPFGNSTGGTGKVVGGKRAAGIIAAAGLAAGGAAGGGGILVGKKLAMLRFTPEDWLALEEDYQTIIENTMKQAGFSNDELDVFKKTKFKIPASEINEHKKKIEKAVKALPTCEEELVELYNYSMIDENHKVIDYLLFITMLIDGKNTIDNYNFYNVVNQGMEDLDDADFIYSGIYMEDYIDDEKDETEEEIQILNDPTVPKEETEIKEEIKEEPKEELEEGFAYASEPDDKEENPEKKEKKRLSLFGKKKEKQEKEEEKPQEEENYTDSLLNKEWLKGIGFED